MKKVLLYILLILPNIAIMSQNMQPTPLLWRDDSAPLQMANFSLGQYNSNPKPWAIALTAVSGASFIAGTSFVSWAFGYASNKHHYNPDADGPMDLTAEATALAGLAFYVVSIGTGIPAVILFKKSKKNTPSSTLAAQTDNLLFPNGVQCQIGIHPSGFGVNIDF